MRRNYSKETQKFKPIQNRDQTLKNMVMPYFRETECKIETYYTVGTQKKIGASDGFYNNVRLYLKQWDVFSILPLSRS